jgi:hypothetical protein
MMISKGISNRIWPALTLAAAVTAASGAAPVLADETAIRCTEEALSALDFDPGAVDGVFDAATENAIKAYLDDGHENLAFHDVNADVADAWCLYFVTEHDLKDIEPAYVAELTDKARVHVKIDMPLEAAFTLFFRHGEDVPVVPDDTQVEEVELKGLTVRKASVPYKRVKTTDNFCVYLVEGWVVRGPDGKGYSASCQPFEPELWASDAGTNYYGLKVEKGTADP